MPCLFTEWGKPIPFAASGAATPLTSDKPPDTQPLIIASLMSVESGRIKDRGARSDTDGGGKFELTLTSTPHGTRAQSTCIRQHGKTLVCGKELSMMMMFITSWQETNARRGEGERNAKKRESSSGEKVHASSHDTGELYLLKWFPTPHHYLPCPAVPSCPCDKLLRECSGGCKVRTLTVCGPRNSALRR